MGAQTNGNSRLSGCEAGTIDHDHASRNRLQNIHHNLGGDYKGVPVGAGGCRWVPLADPLTLTTWEPEGTTGTVKVLANRPSAPTANDCTTGPWNNMLTSSPE